MRVLCVLDGVDPTGLHLAAAAARLGHETVLADLRRSRFTLSAGPGGGAWLDGEPVDVDLVVNRSTVNGLGLGSSGALARQMGRTWYERHSAAREEQGLLLAVFDWFALAGVGVVNAPIAYEMELMRNLVVERMTRQGVPFFRSGSPGEAYLVTGGRVALQSGQARPEPGILRACKLLSEIARFEIGEVRVESPTGEPRVVDWTSRPSLAHLDLATADGLAESVMRELVGAAGGAAPSPLQPIVPDMVERFESG